MQVEPLFVETLIDIRQKLNSNPTEYRLLKVSSLVRQILCWIRGFDSRHRLRLELC